MHTCMHVDLPKYSSGKISFNILKLSGFYVNSIVQNQSAISGMTWHSGRLSTETFKSTWCLSKLG